jgi:tripartite-type tricarboxylate transporter receptor subunit TctC
MHRRNFIQLVLAGAAGQACGTALASTGDNDYPNHLLRLEVTYPAGGSSDLMCRLIAQKMSEVLGQQVIVDNRAGASGSLGMEYAARQPPDGYTFLFGNLGPVVVNPLLSKVPYDMNKDFIPMSLVATGPNVLVINGSRPQKTLREFLELARAKPNSLSFGSGGFGTLAHLFGEMINQSAKIQATHIAYRGGGAAINDLLGSQIDMVVSQTLPVLQYIATGKLTALAVTGTTRFAQLPDVPTFVESGFPDLVALDSWSVYLPIGAPAHVVDRLQAALGKAMTDPGLVKRFYDMGVTAMHSNPEELRTFNAAETVKYAKLIQERGIKAE